MTVLASTVISDARRLLLDVSNAVQRWPDSVLLSILNEGQKALALLNPLATSKVVSHTLVGGTHQDLPPDGAEFYRLICNLSNSDLPGRAITPVSLESIDAFNPGWHSATATSEVKQCAADPANPRKFFVSPPASTGVKVKLSYSAIPADVAAVGSAINVPDIFAPALVDYVIYRALSENDGDAPARERAQMHYVYFTNQVRGGPAFTPARRSTGNA